MLPVAGRGTRLRPLTLNTPKALVLLRGKPLLEYVLEEARMSGIHNVVLITSPAHLRLFKTYVQTHARKKFNGFTFAFVVQETPRGTGHAVLKGAGATRDEPFILRYCDDLLFHTEPTLNFLMRFFETYKKPIFVLQNVPKSAFRHLGIAFTEKADRPLLHRVLDVVEKPDIGEWRQGKNFGVIAAYVITPSIIRHLARAFRFAPPLEDALPITLAFQRELRENGTVLGAEFPGKRFDCGTIGGLRKAESFLAAFTRKG